MIDPGYLYAAPPGSTEWIPLGVAAPPDAPAQELSTSPLAYASGGRSVTFTFQLNDDNLRVIMSALGWSIGDFLAALDPSPPRRTLSRWLQAQTPVGSRPRPHGGPPIRVYDPRPIMKRHAVWAAKHAVD